MTMPHLGNCPHDGDGWCIPCVAEMNRDLERCEQEIIPQLRARQAFLEEVVERQLKYMTALESMPCQCVVRPTAFPLAGPSDWETTICVRCAALND